MGADNAHYQPLNDDLIFIVGRSASIFIFPLFFRNLPPIRRENQIMHHTRVVVKLTAFCMRCKTTVTPGDHKIVVMENGRKRMSAICPNTGCNGKLSKIVG